MNNPLKILMLEDSREDVDLIERELKKGGVSFKSLVVRKKNEFVNALSEFKPDVILSDHSLPQFNSIEALKLYKEYQKENNLSIPFILVTGTVSEEFAVQSIIAGADDYILKDRLKRLPTSIQSALEKTRAETKRMKFLAEVIANEALMKDAEHLAHFGSWQSDFRTGSNKWSDEAFRIYGYEPGETEPGYDKFMSHVHPEDRALVKSSIDEMLIHQDSHEFECRIIDKKGNIKYLATKIVVKRNEEHQPISLTGFNLDITERKKAEILRKMTEEKIKEAYQEKITILESIGDAFYAVDKDWTVTYWNNMAETLLQMPREQIIGKNLWEVYSDAVSLDFYAQYHKAVNENIPVHFQEYYPALKMWSEVSAYPSSAGLSVYFRDITELKKHTKEIMDQNKKLKEIAWMQSHQVRAPLARIMGLIQLIIGYPEQKMDLPDALKHIMTSAHELDDTIRKIVRKTEEINSNEN